MQLQFSQLQFSQLQIFTLGADHTIVWYPDHRKSTSGSNNDRGRGHKMGGAIVLCEEKYGWCGGVVHLCLCVIQSHGRPGTDATGAEERWSHPPGPLRTILWRPGETSLHDQ